MPAYFLIANASWAVGPRVFFWIHMIATTIGADRTNKTRGERYSQKKKKSRGMEYQHTSGVLGWQPVGCRVVNMVWGSSRDTAATKPKLPLTCQNSPKERVAKTRTLESKESQATTLRS